VCSLETEELILNFYSVVWWSFRLSSRPQDCGELPGPLVSFHSSGRHIASLALEDLDVSQLVPSFFIKHR
jgi:hypothetical protein